MGTKNIWFNPTSKRVSILSHPGGGVLIPPLEIKEGVVLGPMLLYISSTYSEFELTLKIWGNIWNIERDFEISKFWDFASIWLTEIAITDWVFDIESSSIACILIFMCSKIHGLQLRLYDQISNYLLFQGSKEDWGRRQGGNLNEISTKSQKVSNEDSHAFKRWSI